MNEDPSATSKTGAALRQSPAEHPVDTETWVKLTPVDLLSRLTVGSWIALVALVAGAYSVGVASTKWGVVQAMFAGQATSTPIAEFTSKAIFEKQTCEVNAGSETLVLFVKDVSIARGVLEIEIGLKGGKREFVQIAPNTPKAIAAGARVYEVVVHDLAQSSLGQDIAVVSLTQKVAATAQ
jgi:hypothetical protein